MDPKDKPSTSQAIAAAAIIATFSFTADAAASPVTLRHSPIVAPTKASELRNSMAGYAIEAADRAPMVRLKDDIDKWLKKDTKVIICIKTDDRKVRLCSLRFGEQPGVIEAISVGPKELLPKGAIVLLA